MKKRKQIILFLVGVILTIIGFSMIPLFPYNLPFNLIGGFMLGYYLAASILNE